MTPKESCDIALKEVTAVYSPQSANIGLYEAVTIDVIRHTALQFAQDICAEASDKATAKKQVEAAWIAGVNGR